jgi:hypothetical protein
MEQEGSPKSHRGHFVPVSLSHGGPLLATVGRDSHKTENSGQHSLSHELRHDLQTDK